MHKKCRYCAAAGCAAGASGDVYSGAAARNIDPSHTAIVVVGNRKAIEPALRASGIGPVVIVDEMGKPVP